MELGTRTSKAVLAAVAALALTGCGQVRTGAAATIGDETIPLERVESVTQSLVEAGGGQVDQGEALRATLGRMIFSEILERAAQRQGVEVSQRNVSAKRKQIEQIVGGPERIREALVRENVAPNYADQVFRDLATSDALSEKLVPGNGEQVGAERNQRFNELLVQVSKDADVTVNPRFGRWDEETGTITGLVSGGLAQSLTEPQPAPGSELPPGESPS